jgi:hypothetical protein
MVVLVNNTISLVHKSTTLVAVAVVHRHTVMVKVAKVAVVVTQ